MNDKPEQLHRFYTKNSYYQYGVEGEDTNLRHGQVEINQQILGSNFKGCKVLVVSLDAQPSANNGILVHAIGEMSHHDEGPWRKFVQVFFLAEQPNGYFVLNDNLRFLKEEEFENEDQEEPAPSEPEPVPESSYAHSQPNGTRLPPSHVQPTAVPVVSHPAPLPVTVPPPVEQPAPIEPVPEPIPRPATPEPVTAPVPAVPDVVEPEPEPVPPPAAPSPAAISRKTPSPAPTTPAAPVAEPIQPPTSTSASPVPPTAHPTPAAAAAPPAPKTWASLAATNSSKWGQNVAQEAKGLSTPPHPTNPTAVSSQPRERPAPAGSSGGGTSAAGAAAGQRQTPGDQHPAVAAAMSVTTPQCFVKSVTENISDAELTSALTSRFGAVKELDILRARACAFLEFGSVDAARRAIIASLPVSQGGEGGIRVGEGRIIVETRKERGDRPTPRPRVNTGDGGGRGAPTSYNQGGNASGNTGYNNRGRGGPSRGRGDASRGGRA